MAKNSNRNTGDRSDGRRIRNLGSLRNLLPHYISRRTAAQKRYEHKFEVSNAIEWLAGQNKAGYGSMSFVHLFIAIFARCCAYLPGVNRFVAGGHIFAHNSVEVVLMTKRSDAKDEGEIPLKLSLDRSDTVFDVYRKVNRAIEKAENDEGGTRTEQLAATVFKRQRILTRFIAWLARVADYFGLLPAQVVAASPFHGSAIVSDNGAIGLASSYNDLHDFGTVPISVNLGRMHSIGEHNFIDIKFVLDGRIVDMEYYASMFAAVQKLLNDPALLEIPPVKIINDEF